MNPLDCDADGTLQSEMLAKQEDDRLRDELGRIVREVWIAWSMEQSAPKPSWLVPYDQLNEPDREVDRRIGERLFREGLRAAVNCRSATQPANEDSARLDWLASQYWKFTEENDKQVAHRTFSLCMSIGIPECPVNLRAAIDAARKATP